MTNLLVELRKNGSDFEYVLSKAKNLLKKNASGVGEKELLAIMEELIVEYEDHFSPAISDVVDRLDELEKA